MKLPENLHIDVDNEELNGAFYLVVGRTECDRHSLVIFGAYKKREDATQEADRTALTFPSKPVWVYEIRSAFRADVSVTQQDILPK